MKTFKQFINEAEIKFPFKTGLPSGTSTKEKIKVPTATELTMKDVNTSTADKLLQKPKYQGEISSYRETPSEYFKGILTKSLGNSREAREKVEKAAGIADTFTGGIGSTIMSGADAIELAKQGRTKEALGKGKEFAIGAGIAALPAAAGFKSNVPKINKKVFRIDDKPISDFNANLKTYGTGKRPDGKVESGIWPPGQMPQGYKSQTGLYGIAGRKAETVGYVFPRGTQNTTVTRGNKKTMVIDKKPPEGHSPTLTTFEKDKSWKYQNKGFLGRPNHPEVFSTNPPKPVSQETIPNPMQYAKDQGVKVIVGDPARYEARVNKLINSKNPIARAIAKRRVSITGEQ